MEILTTFLKTYVFCLIYYAIFTKKKTVENIMGMIFICAKALKLEIWPTCMMVGLFKILTCYFLGIMMVHFDSARSS